MADTEVEIVFTEDQLSELVSELLLAEEFAYDTETTSVDWQDMQLVGMSFAVSEGHAWYVPVGHVLKGDTVSLKLGEPALDYGWYLDPRQLDKELVIERLQVCFEHPAIGKIAHNAKFDWQVLFLEGVDVHPFSFDPMAASHWLSEGKRFGHGLKMLAKIRLDIEMQEITDLIGQKPVNKKKDPPQIPFSQVPIEKAAPYAGADADMTLRLAHKLRPEIKAQRRHPAAWPTEMGLARVIGRMEIEGIPVDVVRLKELQALFKTEYSRLHQEIEKAIGHKINMNSNQQLSDVLYQDLGISTEGVKQLKDKRYWATDAETLERLAEKVDNPIFEQIIQYRKLQKLVGTYISPVLHKIFARTGRVHSTFHQFVVKSGRFASTNPNLMNLPKRSEEGVLVRGAYVANVTREALVHAGATQEVIDSILAGEEWVFIRADYSQAELRVLAHVTGDPALIEAYKRGADLHRETAMAMFRVVIEKVESWMRDAAKVINFGIPYGMGPGQLRRLLACTFEDAYAYLDAYYDKYQRVKWYQNEVPKQCEQRGYVQTLFGHRRYFPIFQECKDMKREDLPKAWFAAKRSAVNHPIQGGAGDIIKKAMVDLYDKLLPYGAYIVLQVHDEIVVLCPKRHAEQVAPIVEKTMENAVRLEVPMVAEANVGLSLLEVK